MKHMVGDILLNVNRGIIVHGCNAQGVMGGGIAAQIKQKYPTAFKEYFNMLKKHEEHGCKDCLGSVNISKIPNTNDFYIANAITQEYYGTDMRHVNYEAIAKAFENISDFAMSENLPIHYPMIGAGLAGGNWTIISTIINETLIGCDHTLWTLT